MTYEARVIPKTLQDPHIYNGPQRARQASQLSDTQPASPSSPPTPEPSISALAAFIVPLLFLGSVGVVTYGGHRLLNLGKWALKEMEGKWSGPRLKLMRDQGSQFIRAIVKGLLSMVRSVASMALLGSIKNRIAGVSQGLEAHQIYSYLGKYRLILSRLVEGTISLPNTP